ncbi:YlxR family protein [Streptomyces sp. NPDC014892]|uniref:YlxR family protein n=1 Tax=Streptomyces caniscabiei TaxID=2746961 RepID=A0ABU4N2P3_9ACTN|nr:MULTISPECIES: YlxR family protein [Streptomyces]MBE4735858.1 YlxR family protein [Streptomyces caniscabiei]MBE4762620.1 YlxR family protein [Streptomyces caniscabiei]MBE4774219.1 YlxR family protein [Streptomyces caniscabiei]MBE4788566.1 YlxR family protein [Streptomyces caniscabiei]MBE4796274.1 YlxR family protein [Streptomyces caniscabiei]
MSGRTRARACPERTCVGCRQRAAKTELLRVVAIEDECVPDPRGTLPGRGAYVHPVQVCLDLGVRRRAFTRALRAPGALDTKALRRYVEQTTVAEQATP